MWTILATAILALFAFYVSYAFWSPHRRRNLIFRMTSSRDAIQGLVPSDMLDNPPAEIARFAPSDVDPASALMFFMKADQKAVGKLSVFLGGLLIALLVAAFYLGIVSLCIIILVVGLTRLIGSTRDGVREAANWLRTVSLILLRWHRSDPIACAQFAEQVSGISPVYDYIANIDN